MYWWKKNTNTTPYSFGHLKISQCYKQQLSELDNKTMVLLKALHSDLSDLENYNISNDLTGANSNITDISLSN